LQIRADHKSDSRGAASFFMVYAVANAQWLWPKEKGETRFAGFLSFPVA